MVASPLYFLDNIGAFGAFLVLLLVRQFLNAPKLSIALAFLSWYVDFATNNAHPLVTLLAPAQALTLHHFPSRWWYQLIIAFRIRTVKPLAFGDPMFNLLVFDLPTQICQPAMWQAIQRQHMTLELGRPYWPVECEH